MSFTSPTSTKGHRNAANPEYSLVAPSDIAPAKERYARKRAPCLKSYIYFSLGIVWLGPAIFLLVVNLSDYVIGASAWCPGSGCRVIDYSNGSSESKSFRKAAQADRDAHSLQGALQFAAKAMEVWFVTLVANLVYNILFSISTRKQGMPLGYALMHIEVCNLITVFKSDLWFPLASTRMSNDADAKEKNKNRTVVAGAIPLVLSLMFLCIMANIAGPSIAVLMIPSQDWIEARRQPATVTGTDLLASNFDSLFAATNPKYLPESLALPGCTSQDFASNRFDCTGDVYGPAWNILAESVVPAVQNVSRYVHPAAGNALSRSAFVPSAELGIPFSFNASVIENPEGELSRSFGGLSTPSRQTLRELADDLGLAYEDVQNPTYSDLGNSLELRISREGPIVEANLTVWYAYSSIIRVGDTEDDRSIYCLQKTALFDNEPSYTKCIQVGTGWNEPTEYASFLYDTQNRNIALDGDVPDDVLELDFVGANRGLYYTNSTPTCFVPSNQSNQLALDACDWDELFSQPIPDFVSQQRAPALSLVFGPPFQNSENPRFVMDVYSRVSMATYSLDITTISPFLDTVEYSVEPDFDPRWVESIHPNWMFASWSVSYQDGSHQSNITGANRPLVPGPRSPLDLLSGLYSQFKDDGPLLNESRSTINETFRSLESDRFRNFRVAAGTMAYFSGVSVLQALSLIPYNATSQAEKSYPMQTWANRRVWKYGVDSRSRAVSTVVMFLAVLVALAWAAAFVYVRTEEHPVTVILASALKHKPEREFDSITSEDRELSSMRFRIPGSDPNGFLLFKKVQ